MKLSLTNFSTILVVELNPIYLSWNKYFGYHQLHESIIHHPHQYEEWVQNNTFSILKACVRSEHSCFRIFLKYVRGSLRFRILNTVILHSFIISSQWVHDFISKRFSPVTNKTYLVWRNIMSREGHHVVLLKSVFRFLWVWKQVIQLYLWMTMPVCSMNVPPLISVRATPCL